MHEALNGWRLCKLILSLTLAIILGMPADAASTGSVATASISRLTTGWWRNRFEEKQAQLRHSHVNLLWLGDSITQNWEQDGPEAWRSFAPIWNRFYGDRQAVNLGFRGDSTCHLLWRLQHGELDDIQPKAAILLIGANNFGHIHTDAQQTYNGIVAILDLLHSRLPKTQVLLIGVLPSIRSQWVTRNTVLLNRYLASLPKPERPWLHYIDVGAALESSNRADPTRFLDPLLTPPDPPLHPTAAAQAALAAMIEPTLTAMIGDYLHR